MPKNFKCKHSHLYVNSACAYVSNSPIVRAYTLLCDGSGECVQLEEVDHEKDLGV